MLNRLGNQIRRAGTCFAIALAVLGQFPVSVAEAEPPSEAQIRDARKQYDAAIAQRDFAALSKLTTAEVQMTGPVVRSIGIASLQESLKRLVKKRPDLALKCDVEAIEVNETWNVAAERGRWRETWMEKDSPVDLRGSYLAMWKRIVGKWLLDAWLFVPQSCKGDRYCKGADEPLQMRLPTVELIEGTRGPIRYETERLMAALYAVGGRPLPGQTGDLERAIVLLWDDGRALWSDNSLEGGAPFRTGVVPVSRAAAIAERLKASGSATASVLHLASIGPDASFATLFVRLGDGRYAYMRSWHPRGPNPDVVATSHGLQARDGRDPAAVLAADSYEYQAFRRTWQNVEDDLAALIKTASPSSKAASAKLVWGWIKGWP